MIHKSIIVTMHIGKHAYILARMYTYSYYAPQADMQMKCCLSALFWHELCSMVSKQIDGRFA